MCGFWQRRLGVKGLVRMAGYNPMGDCQLAFKSPERRAGCRHQYRFDISDDDLESQMRVYGLYHRLTNGDDLPSFIDTVPKNDGAMVSTLEKLRAGIPVRGVSPKAGIHTGWGTCFFTRIRKLPPPVGSRETELCFERRLLRRMDAISCDHDALGRVRDD